MGIRAFNPSKLYDGEESVMVDVGGEMIEVWMDPEGSGPMVVKIDGSDPGPNDIMKLLRVPFDGSIGRVGIRKPWSHYTSTERKNCVHMAAKINKQRLASARGH